MFDKIMYFLLHRPVVLSGVTVNLLSSQQMTIENEDELRAKIKEFIHQNDKSKTFNVITKNNHVIKIKWNYTKEKWETFQLTDSRF